MTGWSSVRNHKTLLETLNKQWLAICVMQNRWLSIRNVDCVYLRVLCGVRVSSFALIHWDTHHCRLAHLSQSFVRSRLFSPQPETILTTCWQPRRIREEKKKPPRDAVDARFLIKAVKPEMGWQRTQIILMYASLCFKSAAVYSILPLPCEKPGSLSAHRCERIKAFSCSQREKGWGVEGGGWRLPCTNHFKRRLISRSLLCKTAISDRSWHGTGGFVSCK